MSPSAEYRSQLETFPRLQEYSRILSKDDVLPPMAVRNDFLEDVNRAVLRGVNPTPSKGTIVNASN
jgi:hypothetical protein